MEKENKEIPFGAKDSELYKFEYTIPEGYEAGIKDGKVIITKKESEDERIRKSIVSIINQYARMCEKEGDPCEASLINDALAYLEKQKEQKPIFKKGDKVIWQDEEYNILDVNEDSYNVGGYILPFYRQNELSLVEQEPAECSEKDEKMLETIDKTLFKASVNTGLGTIRCPYDDARDWLKSLRPQSHWKPSEEQMNALENVIKCELSAGLHTRAEILQTLRNDLKKL